MCDMTTYVAIPEDLILPADLLPDDFDDDVIGVCWVAVVIGDSVEDITEIITEEYDEISNEQAKNIAEYLITARRTQQEQFGDVTTNLDAAFAELEQHGIIARAYCGWTSRDPRRSRRHPARQW